MHKLLRSFYIVATALLVASAHGQADGKKPPEQWVAADYQALNFAWLHTSGSQSFEFLVFETTDPIQARIARVQRWGSGTRVKTESHKADSLVDVAPPWRMPLAQLFDNGRRSPVFPVVRDGQTKWTIIELVRRAPAAPPKGPTEFRRKAARWVSEGLLPSPEELQTDLVQRSRIEFWRAITSEQVEQLPAELPSDVRFGSGMTPLSRAIFIGRLDLAKALLKRGADPAFCGIWGCPMHTALWLEDPRQTDEAIALLLAAGAKPDPIDPAFDAAASTPLVEAIRTRRDSAVELLLRAGASPDGVAGTRLLPLDMALATGQRQRAEALLALGASPLPWSDRARDDLGLTTIAFAAQESKDPSLIAWTEQLLVDAATKSPRYRWDAHIEQDGKRFALNDGATVTLRAAPFKLVLTLPPTSEASVAVAASRSADLAAQVRRIEKRNGIFNMAASSALAEAPDAGSYGLLVYATAPDESESARTDGLWGAHMNLSRAVGDQGRKDFHEKRDAKNEFVREFRSVTDVFDDARKPVSTPLTALKGLRLTLALGAPIFIERFGYQRLISPRVVTLVLR